ncbi:GINS subunit domain A [Trinorchestia longiramus]|nr:GINS subunit domain A [Trinorchestia longiramus]
MANFEVSYFPNYFSIDDILASQDRIPCKFEVIVKGLGYLDASSGSSDIQPGSKLELPCWLARRLCTTARKPTVSAQLPVTYRDKYREILTADACVVDLQKLGPHFYELGLHLLPLTSVADRPRLAALLTQVLRDRLRPVMDDAQHCSVDEATHRIAKLDRLEIRLFRGEQESVKDYQAWMERTSHLLKMAPLLAASSSRKRKREDP